MDEKLAKAIAEKLGIDEAKVTKALEEVRAEQQASRQASASPRLPVSPLKTRQGAYNCEFWGRPGFDGGNEAAQGVSRTPVSS